MPHLRPQHLERGVELDVVPDRGRHGQDRIVGGEGPAVGASNHHAIRSDRHLACGQVQKDALGSDLGREPLRELLVAALAMEHLGLRPIFLEAAAFDGREQTEIALPIRWHARFGDEVPDDRLFCDLGRIDGHDFLGDGGHVELLGVGAFPWRVLKDGSGVVADRLKDVVQSLP